jgi:NADH-quinone oxidoreductase subunit A
MGIVAYLAVFTGVAIVFLFANLLLGRFLRASDPHAEKKEIYECGEPTIGSSFVQFDLRFYVVALLFIIFDVEVAFFFPWATVFGKASHLSDERFQVVQTESDGTVRLTDQAELLYRELGVSDAVVPERVPASLSGEVGEAVGPQELASQIIKGSARQLAWVTIADIAVFFAVLLVGFAYVWKRGDLDWVRAMGRERSERSATEGTGGAPAREPVMSA